jgi:hypothetical protein
MSDLPAPSMNSAKGFAIFVVGVLVALFILSQFSQTRTIGGIAVKGALPQA